MAKLNSPQTAVGPWGADVFELHAWVVLPGLSDERTGRVDRVADFKGELAHLGEAFAKRITFSSENGLEWMHVDANANRRNTTMDELVGFVREVADRDTSSYGVLMYRDSESDSYLADRFHIEIIGSGSMRPPETIEEIADVDRKRPLTWRERWPDRYPQV